MKRSDLINYLQMLCATEYASYTCHNIIDKLEVIQNDYLKSRNQNYDDWRNANLRKQKQYNQYVYPLWDNHYGFYCGIIVSVVVLIVSGLNKHVVHYPCKDYRISDASILLCKKAR